MLKKLKMEKSKWKIMEARCAKNQNESCAFSASIILHFACPAVGVRPREICIFHFLVA